MEIILYLELNLLCIAILFMVYVQDAKQRNNDTYHILFTRVLFANVLFFFADILWGLMALTQHPHIWQNWIVNVLYFSLSGVAAYFWLRFVEQTISPNRKEKKLHAFFKLLPCLLLIALSLASLKTHWLFYIDEFGKYQRGNLYLLQPLLAYILPLYATGLALTAMKKTQNSEKKQRYCSLALFYVLPALGGVGQVVFQGTPLLNIGIALSGLWVYFTFQENVIMLDALTNLHNRRSFDRTLEAMVHDHEEDTDEQLWLILMDVDYFKKINDGFGHAEGDRALITIAEVLKEVAGEYNCSSARIGGDEFAICCEGKNARLPLKICESIRTKLAEKSGEYPFRITMSMGCAQYTNGMQPPQLYIAADEKLYAAKNER